MERVLITGADGFVGRHLVRTMHAAGLPIVAVTREERVPAPAGMLTARVEDMRQCSEWDSMLKNVGAVIHLAARAHVIAERARDPLEEFRNTNVKPTLNLFRSCQRAGVKRFVFVSSIGVNGVATKDVPFRDRDAPNPTEPYALSKWEAECGLAELALQGDAQLVVVRPALIYGPGAKGNFLRLMRLIRSGWPLPLGSVRATRSILSGTSLCELLIRCSEDGAAAGRVFLAADRRPIPTRDLVIALAQLMGRRARLVHIAPRVLVRFGRLAGFGLEMDRLVASLEVDSSPARDLLGWNGEGNCAGDMQRMVEDFLGRDHVV